MLKIVRYETDKVTDGTSLYSDIMTQEVLSQGFNVQVKGRGMSMYPLVQTGDTLRIEPASATELNIGDIVFYRLPIGTYVIHRLIKKNGNATLITKGDNQPHYDTPISIDDVLGRVVQIEGGGKRVKLNGWPSRMLGWLIAWLAHGYGLNLTRFSRHLGRLWWLIGGRRVA
jgi:hypothetical protein